MLALGALLLLPNLAHSERSVYRLAWTLPVWQRLLWCGGRQDTAADLYPYMDSRLLCKSGSLLRGRDCVRTFGFNNRARWSTSHHGSLRARSSSAFWLRKAAVEYIGICKRRSDRFVIVLERDRLEVQHKYEELIKLTRMHGISHEIITDSLSHALVTDATSAEEFDGMNVHHHVGVIALFTRKAEADTTPAHWSTQTSRG